MRTISSQNGRRGIKSIFKKKKVSLRRLLPFHSWQFKPVGPSNKSKGFPGQRHFQSQYFLQMERPTTNGRLTACQRLASCLAPPFGSLQQFTPLPILDVSKADQSQQLEPVHSGTRCHVNASDVTNQRRWGAKDQQVWFIRRLAAPSLAFPRIAPLTAGFGRALALRATAMSSLSPMFCWSWCRIVIFH